MRVFVVFNPKAGAAGAAEALRDRLKARADVTVVTPESPEDTQMQAAHP